MNKLQQDVRQYVRVARKTKGQIKNFKEFNSQYNTEIPITEASGIIFDKFLKSLKRQRSSNGFPVQGRLFNIYNALAKVDSPLVSIPVKQEMIPPPSVSLKPVSIRAEKIEQEKPLKKQKTSEFNMAMYKEQLESWKEKHPQSKLNTETQLVYFVPNSPIENFEHYAAKLTKSTGAILEKGGIFKMRSGLKKEILGMDSKVAADIVSKVTKGGKGPFFLPIACVTGSKKCNC